MGEVREVAAGVASSDRLAPVAAQTVFGPWWVDFDDAGTPRMIPIGGSRVALRVSE